MPLLAHFAGQSSLDLVAQGEFTPQDTKAKLIAILEPHFKNRRILKELAVTLAPEAVNLRAIEQDSASKQLYLKVMGHYRAAELVDANACYKACRHWEQGIQDGIAEYWSALHLNIDLNILCIDDFKFESLRIIGLLIEALMQPALRELLFQARLGAGKKCAAESLCHLELGVVIEEELARFFGYSAFLAPKPWNVKLNQWRNIAQHFASRVDGQEIVCAYGRGRNKHELRLTREELLKVVETIYSTARAVKTARTIFVLDNIEHIGLDSKGLRLRDDVKLLHLGSAFATQGFELVRFEVNSEGLKATVRDLAKTAGKTRMAHSSQFVYPIWREFPHSQIAVCYLDTGGTQMLTSTIEGTVCEEIETGALPLQELAKRVDLILTDAGRALITGRQHL